MARPQAANYDERKSLILATAAKLFASEGYHKASLSAVAKACNMSKSLVYHYYSSKQDLLYHAMIDHVRDLDKLAQEVMQEDASPEVKLRRIIHRYLKIYENTVAEHHLLINELSSLPEKERRQIIKIQNKVVKAFADLAAALSPADLTARQAKTAVALLMLGMINWTYIWFKKDGPITSEALAELIIEIFLKGLPGLS